MRPRTRSSTSRPSSRLNRRELRLSTKELEQLGCYVDEGNPLAVIIPGADGKHEHGFRWDTGALDLIELGTTEVSA